MSISVNRIMAEDHFDVADRMEAPNYGWDAMESRSEQKQPGRMPGKNSGPQEEQVNEKVGKPKMPEYVNVVIYGDYGTTKKEYLYHTFFDVQVGDLVAVETESGYVIGQVISLLNQLPKGIHFELKEVVQKINTHQVEVKKAQGELKVKMRAILETVDEMELFTMLAGQREDMFTLWQQYQKTLD